MRCAHSTCGTGSHQFPPWLGRCLLNQELKKTLLFCDEEEEYTQLMTEFLEKHKDLPWQMRSYTDAEEMVRQEKDGADFLVIAESSFSEGLRKFCREKAVILSESGRKRWEEVHYVDKYGPAEEVYHQLLEIYAESGLCYFPRLQTKSATKFIGNYSPVRRRMQTSFALTLGQLLAEEHRVLYLNFEHYAGIGELLPDMQTLDLSDLLYFVNAEQEKFRLRMQSMMKHVGKLDYIPPMKVGQNLLPVTGEEWLEFLRKLEELGEYEYIILDLSESMQGLFDILRLCSSVFTMQSKDRQACAKILQYEYVLSLYAYEDVLSKTNRLDVSGIHRIPDELEQLPRGELANMAREMMQAI